jgi:hypothetical protein
MRIFPVTLRVARYSRARAHASWPGRPRIHFVGEMHLGSSVVAQPDPGVRLVEGTVQMAASGDVRWSMVCGVPCSARETFSLTDCFFVLC